MMSVADMRATIGDSVSELYDLEAIAEQTSLRINQGGTRSRFHIGWQISPNIERASASRESSKVIAKPKRQKPAPAIVATRDPATPAEIFSYDDLLLSLRARANELQISRETVGALAGVPDGYAQKVLSLSQNRRIGMQTLGAFLDALSVKLIMVVDEAALARNRGRYKPRDDAHFRSATARPKTASERAVAKLTRWARDRGLTVVIGDDTK
jgi:hypothetical protein